MTWGELESWKIEDLMGRGVTRSDNPINIPGVEGQYSVISIGFWNNSSFQGQIWLILGTTAIDLFTMIKGSARALKQGNPSVLANTLFAYIQVHPYQP